MAKRQVDERILETRRKVSGRGFYLLLWGMLAILLYRQFYLGQAFADYGDIFVLWLIGSLYVTIGGTLSGLNLFGERKFNVITVPMVIALTTLGVGIYQGRIQSIWEGLLSFTTSLVGAGITLYLVILLYRSWEKKNLDQ